METNESFNEVPITIPSAIEGPGKIENWYTKEGVYEATAFYFRKKKNGNSTEIKQAERFFEQVKDGYHEREFGPSPKLRKIAINQMKAEQRFGNLINYLAWTVTVDLEKMHLLFHRTKSSTGWFHIC